MAFVHTTHCRCWEEKPPCSSPGSHPCRKKVFLACHCCCYFPPLKSPGCIAGLETAALTLLNFALTGSPVPCISWSACNTVPHATPLCRRLETPSSSSQKTRSKGTRWRAEKTWPHRTAPGTWCDHRVTRATRHFLLWRVIYFSSAWKRLLPLCPHSPPSACCCTRLKGMHPLLITHLLW